ncbi:MAG: hypothetical protein LBQ58_11350 [Synergistaceae bacterium]|jgi:hypothetical protein|nr:hypothetical protein [Synergistaceae bacterium]
MRLSIGIISAERSVELIRRAHDALSDICDVTYLPYTSMRHLSHIYEQNARLFDGLIFSGRFPYSYIVSNVGGILKPCAYFELTDRDYYRAFAGILYRFPGISVSRILIDRPYSRVDFADVFGGDVPTFFDPMPQDSTGLGFAYEMTMEQSLRLWREKKIDLIVTRFTNLADSLRVSGIPFELLFPSVASMLDACGSLCALIQSRRLVDSMVASGIVAGQGSDDAEGASLLSRLERFNGQNGMSMVIRRNGGVFELTTSNGTLKDITEGYSNCLLTSYLHDAIGPRVCVGWGLGADIVSSGQNALRALRESMRSSRHYAYLINDLGDQIGPMVSGRVVTMTGVPSAAIERMGRRLGIFPSNLQKIMDLQEKRGIGAFSSANLAFYLNITPRSAGRILSRLAEHGAASVTRGNQPNVKGRPYKIYDVDCGKWDSLLSPEKTALRDAASDER